MHMKCNISKTANHCIWVIINSRTAYAESLLPISGFVLNEKFQRNASKFAIFYIPILKPKVAFSVFYFVQLYVFLYIKYGKF